MCARPAKSQALHDLHGTELRSNLAESHVAGALPRPPKHLTKAAKKSFRSYVKQLASGGRRAVTAGDGALIGILCVTEERWLQALENLRDEGVVVEYTRLDAAGSPVTVEKPNINLKIAEICERSMVAILSKLGLTPKDRETVKPTAPVTTGKEKTTAERLAEEIQALEQQTENDPVVADDEDLLSEIDETLADPPMTETEKLMQEADRMLAEDE
jgi:P27 family predicted phage terminase small subunit